MRTALRPKRRAPSLHAIPAGIRELPECYPFGDLVRVSLSTWAEMTKQTLKAVQHQADRGYLPIIQDRPGAQRFVNLIAVYMDARYSGMLYLARKH